MNQDTNLVSRLLLFLFILHPSSFILHPSERGNMPRVIVVGAGISGLALARRLEALLGPGSVLVLEQRPRPGGMIGTVRRDGFLVETGPNGFLDNNPVTLDLARGLGLQDKLLHASEAAGRKRFLML